MGEGGRSLPLSQQFWERGPGGEGGIPMSEQSVRPDVQSLIQALYEQAGQLTSQVRFHDVGTVQRISDSASTFPSLPHARPDVPSLLQALRQQAGQLTSQARFHEIGIVQRVGDGVATLSGLRRARTGELLTFPTGTLGLILNLAFAPIAIAIPILSERMLDTGALGYAWLMMSWAVGMLIGSIAIGQWGNRFRKRSTLLYGGIGVGVPLCFVSLLNTLTPCIIMFFILGLFLSVINIPINTLMQEVTPDPIRGRVHSISGIISLCAMPLGMGIGGALIDWIGVRHVFLLIGITMLVVGETLACTKTLRRY